MAAVANFQEPAAQTNESAEPASAPGTAGPAPPSAQPSAASDQQGPFTLDQVRAWAQGKQPPAAGAPAPSDQEQPFTLDQVREWANRGTGIAETSPALQQPSWWENLLFGSELQTNIGRLLVGHMFAGGAQIAAGIPRTGAAAIEAFTGKTIPEMQAYRVDLQNRLDEINKEFQDASKGGAFDGEQAAGLAQGAALLEEQIKYANAYIASGGQSVAPARNVAKSLSLLSDLVESAGRSAQAGAGEVPVQTQATPAGQIAAAAGEMTPQVISAFAGGTLGGILGRSVELSTFAAQAFESQHQEARENGADERTANLAGLIGMAGVPFQMAAAEVPRSLLSEAFGRMLANQTAREGLANLARVTAAWVSGGAGMGSYQFMQNVAARVSGYDPNRPLDRGVWQQAAAGAILDSGATLGSLIVGRAMRPPAEVEVRAKPGAPSPAPPETGQPPPIPTQRPPVAPVSPLEQRLPEEQVQYPPQAPEQALGQLTTDLDKALEATALGAEDATQAAAVRLGVAAPSETPEELAQRTAQISAGIQEEFAHGFPEPSPEPAEPELAAPRPAAPRPAAAEPEPVRLTPPAEEPPQPAPKREGFVEPPPTEPTQPVPLEPGERASIEQRLYDAYQTLSAERQRTSLPIGEVVERAGVPLEQAKSAIIGLGDKVQLDQGDWPSATDAQRAAAIHAAGRPRLYMAFTEPLGAALSATPVALADQNRILSAYYTLRAQGQPESVAISDLQRQSGLPLSVVQAWLARNQNAIALHEGDWANASTNNRNAALNVNGRKNLLADLSALSRAMGAPGQLLARLPGPRTAEVRFPTEPVTQLSQREVKRTVNASASQAGLDGKVSYVPTERSLPRRVRLAMARQGYEPGSAQTVWDRNLRQLWVIGDAFPNADELHRALIEETVPRAFDGLRFPIGTVHDETDPRLGWWDPVSEQATLNTAALFARPQPLVDASKTAVHEAVVHGGFTQLFASTPEGRAAYVAAMHAARNYFDSTGISQRLARARGFSGIEDMTQAYAREYGRTGARLTNLVTEELLAAFAEERFPTRTSLERAPAWYQSVLGELGSEIRQAFGWRVNDWDVQQLIRDSFAAVRQGKEPIGVGAIPVHSVAIRPDEHAMAVLDVHPTTDYARANIGQLNLGRPLSEEEADRLQAFLEGAGHPIGIINRPEGPVFVNYGEDRLANHDFQNLAAMAIERVLGPGYAIELARNRGTYPSNDADTIARSNQINASRPAFAPGERATFEYGRELSPAPVPAAASEAGWRPEPIVGPRAGAVGITGRPEGIGAEVPTAEGTAILRGTPELAAATGATPEGRAAGARAAGPAVYPGPGGAEELAGRRAAPAGAGVTNREELATGPERDTYERSSLGEYRGAPEPLPGYERGAAGSIGRPALEAIGTEPGGPGRGELGPGAGDSIGEIFARASLRGGDDMGSPNRPADETPFRSGGSAKMVEAMTGEKLPYAPRPLDQAMNEARVRFRGLGNDIYAGQRWLEAHPEVYGTDQGAAMRVVISQEFDRQIQDLRDRNFAQAAVDLTHSKELWLRDEAARETALGQALNAQKLLYTDGNSAVARWQKQIADTQQKADRIGGSKRVSAAYERLSEAQKAAIDQLLAQAEPAVRRAQEQIDQSLEERYRHAATDAINQAFGRMGFTSPDERPLLEKLYQSWESTITQMVKERAGELPPVPPRIKISAGETIRNAISNVPLFERAWTEAVEKLKLENPNALFFQKLDSALDAPFSQAQIGSFIREQGINLRELVRQHYAEIGRTGQALYQKLIQGTGLSEEQALKIQTAFDRYFGSAITAERERQVQEILAHAAPNAPKPLPQSEVARVLKLMNLGLFDKDEYHNAIAKMLGLESWDRQKLQEMKNAGNMVQQLLAEAGPRDLVNKWMARMTDLMLDQAPTMRKGGRDAQSLWMASLLTGPFTHGSYYGQNLLNNVFDLAFNTVGKRDFNITHVPALLSTYARSLLESARRDLPYSLATGTPMHVGEGVETAFGKLPRKLPFRSRLEAAGPGAKWYEGPLQFKGPLAVLNAYNAYKYVGRFLSGMETVFRNGARDSVSYALGVRLGDRLGYTKEQSQELGRSLVYGTQKIRDDAIQQASDEAARWGLTPLERARRVEELIDDRLRDQSPEIAGQAERYAQLAIYRNSPYGIMGKVTAFLNELKRDHLFFGSLFSPFVTLPGNVINDMVNYSPLGFWRAGFELGGRRFGGPESLFDGVPGFNWDELSEQEKSDIKSMFMGKAYTGMALLGRRRRIRA